MRNWRTGMSETMCSELRAPDCSEELACGHRIKTISGRVFPCGLPQGHKGRHLNLYEMSARCDVEIRGVVFHGKKAVERGDEQEGWFADKILIQLRKTKADIEQKIAELPNTNAAHD